MDMKLGSEVSQTQSLQWNTTLQQGILSKAPQQTDKRYMSCEPWQHINKEDKHDGQKVSFLDPLNQKGKAHQIIWSDPNFLFIHTDQLPHQSLSSSSHSTILASTVRKMSG